jgi:putative spermidine/putrescine transport system permease protein
VLCGAAIAIYAFMFGPILITAAVSFNAQNQSRFPPIGFSLRWWDAAFDPTWLGPILFSLKLSSLSAIAATAMGLPFAFALVRHEFPGRGLLSLLALSPLMLPALVTGIGLLQFLQLAGLGDFLGLPALVVGHIVICIPFTVRTIAISLSGLPRNLENAAISLGARPRMALWTVTLPLIKGGIFAGATFAFVQSFTDYSMSLFLADASSRPVTIMILNFIEFGFTPTLAAVAVITLLIPLLLVLLVQRAFRVGDFLYGAPAHG